MSRAADDLLAAISQDPDMDDNGKARLYALALAARDGRGDDVPWGDLRASEIWVRRTGYYSKAVDALAAL